MLSFNTTYVVAGAAAAALIILVLVLVVVRSRGRRAQVASRLDAGPEWTTLADSAVVGVGETSVVDAGDAAVAAAETMAETTPEFAPAADIGPESLPAEPVPPLDRPAALPDRPAVALDLRPGIDPAVTLITSLIQISGELDPEELRRLELFRPERIVAAVQALTPGMTGRSNESKRSRLMRIRQYADSLMAEPMGETTTAEVAVASDPAPVRPPEAWGGDIDGARLTLDPELSLLDEQAALAPEAVPTPEAALAPEADDTAEDAPAESVPNDSDDTDKRAAIDTLARLATPEALSRLQRYLDDPDPEIQLYALSAAERLLGPE